MNKEQKKLIKLTNAANHAAAGKRFYPKVFKSGPDWLSLSRIRNNRSAIALSKGLADPNLGFIGFRQDGGLIVFQLEDDGDWTKFIGPRVGPNEKLKTTPVFLPEGFGINEISIKRLIDPAGKLAKGVTIGSAQTSVVEHLNGASHSAWKSLDVIDSIYLASDTTCFIPTTSAAAAEKLTKASNIFTKVSPVPATAIEEVPAKPTNIRAMTATRNEVLSFSPILRKPTTKPRIIKIVVAPETAYQPRTTDKIKPAT